MNCTCLLDSDVPCETEEPHVFWLEMFERFLGDGGLLNVRKGAGAGVLCDRSPIWGELGFNEENKSG